MTFRPVETKAFQQAKTRLSPNGRIALPHAIDGILDQPLHERQHLRPDGAVVDFRNEGLMIAFRPLSGERIRFLGVVDVKKEHRWP